MWFGLLVSYVYVFGFIGVAQVLVKSGVVSADTTRKIIHIGVAHWWLVAMAVFDSVWFALVGPVTFVVINYVSWKLHLFRAMEHEQPRKNLGTIYFPISLVILVLATWGGPLPLWYGATAILVLGWGDGMASLVGERVRSGRFQLFGSSKSIAGTLAMLTASWVAASGVLFAFSGLQIGAVLAAALILASVAAVVELLTPFGLDNITVPIAVVVALGLVAGLETVWLIRIAWALGLNLAAAGLAFSRRSVTFGGAVAGASVGVAIFLSGGFWFWSVLMVFFASSSALSAIKTRNKEEAQRRHHKGSRRDVIQVLANGGVATVMSVLYALTGLPVFMVAFAIAIAAANADTWASEIGVLSRREPISVLTFRPIPPGTSGGVSALGLIASAAGAMLVAGVFAIGYWAVEGWHWLEMPALVAAVTGGGFLGSLVDSVLGASVQAQYLDAITGAITEHRFTNGIRNTLDRGFHVFTNDAVNALSGLVSTLTMIAILT